jgi:hypothetical protein
MHAEPQAEHQWLTKLVGDWTMESEAKMAPDKPSEKFKGTETVRALGGIWILADGQGEMPGGGVAHMQMMLGYDPQKKRYVGTWVGSMMTTMMIYDGEMDAAGKVLTLNTEGPSMTGDGTTMKYQDIIEVRSDDHRVLTSRVLGQDGKWTEFMTAHYRRTK